jgi:methylglutaconyl-CoA hydratase
MQGRDHEGPDARVTVLQSPHCCTVTLNRAEKANALDAGMMAALAGAAAAAAPGLPLVLRSASSSVFCAGADIAEFAGGAGELARQEHALLAMIEAFAATPSPVVVAAHGRASGAGAILLCLADVVVAADDLQVAAPEIRFGMYPVIVEAVLQSRFSPALSSAICMSGRSLDAGEAARIGLATEVLPRADFERASRERVDHYVERSVGLSVARRARLSSRPARELRERLRAVSPLMGENYADEGVRRRIDAYLATLGQRA